MLLTLICTLHLAPKCREFKLGRKKCRVCDCRRVCIPGRNCWRFQCKKVTCIGRICRTMIKSFRYKHHLGKGRGFVWKTRRIPIKICRHGLTFCNKCGPFSYPYQEKICKNVCAHKTVRRLNSNATSHIHVYIHSLSYFK